MYFFKICIFFSLILADQVAFPEGNLDSEISSNFKSYSETIIEWVGSPEHATFLGKLMDISRPKQRKYDLLAIKNLLLENLSDEDLAQLFQARYEFRDQNITHELIKGLPESSFIFIPVGLDYFLNIELQLSQILDVFHLLRINEETIPKNLLKQVQLILENYFDYMPLELKKIILAKVLLGGPIDFSKPIELLLRFFKSSGPVIQKLLQLLQQEMHDQFIKDLFVEVKSSLPKMTRPELHEALGLAFPGEMDIFAEFDMNSKGAGSVGQIHVARLKNGQKVIVKLRKVGIEKLAKLEFDGLYSIVENFNCTELQKTVTDMKLSVYEELDFNYERESLKMAMKYEKYGIHVAGLASDIGGKYALILNLAPGYEVSTLPPNDTALQADLLFEVRNTMIRWLERALMGDGFFHADPHEGNLFYDPTRRKNKITFIDLGNTGTLTTDEKKGYVLLVASVGFADYDMFKDSITLLSADPEVSYKLKTPEFETKIISEMKNEDSLQEKITSIYSMLLQEKVDLAPTMTRLIRGAGFLGNLLRDTEINAKRGNQQLQFPPIKKVVIELLATYVKERMRTVLCVGGACPRIKFVNLFRKFQKSRQ